VAEKGATKLNPPMAAVLALKPAAREHKPVPRPERWEDTVAVVTVRGDLDREAIESIDYAVALASAEAGRIVLDLLDVGHLDYAGVSLLVGRRRALVGRGGEMLIAVRNPYVGNILKAAGGAELVLCRTVEQASGAVVVVGSPARRRGR
jgi:stage II sporulation protein AA (anti-sigma F factor antagonist)